MRSLKTITLAVPCKTLVNLGEIVKNDTAVLWGNGDLDSPVDIPSQVRDKEIEEIITHYMDTSSPPEEYQTTTIQEALDLWFEEFLRKYRLSIGLGGNYISLVIRKEVVFITVELTYESDRSIGNWQYGKF